MPNYSRYIEYTNLTSPKSKDIKNLIEVANKNNYAGVCLQPCSLRVADKYRKPDLKLITIAGFPPIHTFHLFTEQNKKFQLVLGLYKNQDITEMKNLLDSKYVDELDIVFPFYWYVSGKFVKIHKFLKGLKNYTPKPIKVIIELGTIFKKDVPLFEIIDLLKQANIDYLKTNTGLIKQDFDKRLYPAILSLKALLSDLSVDIKLKASGGIKTDDHVKKLVRLGINRIGTSSTITF